MVLCEGWEVKGHKRVCCMLAWISSFIFLPASMENGFTSYLPMSPGSGPRMCEWALIKMYSIM